MKIAACAGASMLALACAQAVPASPGDAELPLALAGPGPYYVLDVGLRARAVSASADLADLRVRNGAGETMAFAWLDAALPPPAPRRAPARLYKVPLPPVDAASAVPVDAAPRQAWIVDAGATGDDLLRLALALEPGTQGVYALRIEASDDLQHWRMLQEDAQLVQLEALPQVGTAGALGPMAGREQLGTGGIDLDNVRARYLRVTTARRSAVPPLVSATITRAPHRAAPPPLEWSAAIGATACEASSCDYLLPRNASVAALQVAPADVDTIAPVMVLGLRAAGRAAAPSHSLLRHPLHALRLKAERTPASAVPAWDSVAVTSVYWLTQAAGPPDLHSPPVRLDGAAWQALRLETFGPISQLGHGAPTLRIGVRTRQLVFVARGAGPFTLARATAADATAALSPAELMPGRALDAARPAATATLAPVATKTLPAAAPASAATPSAAVSAPWLWAALLAGLALMAAMAWSLLRKPARPAP
jgi:hypothetical protein